MFLNQFDTNLVPIPWANNPEKNVIHDATFDSSIILECSVSIFLRIHMIKTVSIYFQNHLGTKHLHGHF